MSARQGINLGPFKGFGGKAPRQPLNRATASDAPTNTNVKALWDKGTPSSLTHD